MEARAWWGTGLLTALVGCYVPGTPIPGDLGGASTGAPVADSWVPVDASSSGTTSGDEPEPEPAATDAEAESTRTSTGTDAGEPSGAETGSSTSTADCVPSCAGSICGEENGCGGECAADGECDCGPELDPQCGTDGITYYNDCLRQKSGVATANAGECGVGQQICYAYIEPDCPAGTICVTVYETTEACFASTYALGKCWSLPSDCDAAPRRYRSGCDPDAAQPCVDVCGAALAAGHHIAAPDCEN